MHGRRRFAGAAMLHTIREIGNDFGPLHGNELGAKRECNADDNGKR
jgi:hypothetical protein